MKQKKVAAKKAAKTKPKKKKHPVVFSGGAPGPSVVDRSREERLKEQCALLGVMAKATIASLERQDRETWELSKKYENEPMVPGSVVWHVHQ